MAPSANCGTVVVGMYVACLAGPSPVESSGTL